MGQGTVNEWMQAIAPYVTGMLVPAGAWLLNRSVRHGERLSKLEGEQFNVGKGLDQLRIEFTERFRELRDDIKSLGKRMDKGP